jgi:peptidyl-prolyl cis-trans isomerase SurA
MNCPRSMRILLFLAMLALPGFHHASGETLNRVVAIVNDDLVTLYELNKKIKELTGRTPVELRSQNEDQYYEVRGKILELLIDDKIKQAKVLEMGIEVSQKKIDDAIEKIKSDNKWTQEDLVSRIQKEGLSLEKYKENMKEELERIELINYEVRSRILIREETMTQYYEEHKNSFSGEVKVHLASIFLLPKNPEDKKESLEIEKKGGDILARLKGGEDFKDLARKFSQGPGAEDGGYLGVFQLDELNPGLKKILEVIPEGGFTDLIIMPKGVQIIMVVKKEGGKAKSFEDVQDAIYGILYQEEIDKRYNAWIQELRERSYTKIIF